MFRKSARDPFKFEDRTDSEEFDHRVDSLRLCIGSFNSKHTTKQSLESTIARPDVNTICKPQMSALKDFINKTKVRYENVYAPIDLGLFDIVRKTDI